MVGTTTGVFDVNSCGLLSSSPGSTSTALGSSVFSAQLVVVNNFSGIQFYSKFLTKFVFKRENIAVCFNAIQCFQLCSVLKKKHSVKNSQKN